MMTKVTDTVMMMTTTVVNRHRDGDDDGGDRHRDGDDDGGDRHRSLGRRTDGRAKPAKAMGRMTA
jgi:hypothetical protein